MKTATQIVAEAVQKKAVVSVERETRKFRVFRIEREEGVNKVRVFKGSPEEKALAGLAS